ncbi:MAG TPA: electron transfer flavoprotein subunit beta, partial [Fervidobacterium sp.]|nr:electron transfer flavoprotein subunit beta [Fervidobacterium sp.]
CVITCSKDMNTPRYMNLYDLFGCYSKEIKVLNNSVLNFDKMKVGLVGSPTKVRKTFTKAPKGEGKVFQGSVEESVEKITEVLSEVLNIH